MPSVETNFNLNPFSQLDIPEEHQQLKSTSTENYLRTTSNEKNIAMSNERNFVKRGDLHGPIFELDHLATFSVGSRQGLLKAEDGMRKLRVMEKSHGIWTMECQMMIDVNYLVVLDKKTGQEVEKFPLSLVHDPVSVVSDDKKDIYNNIILFTVLQDNRKNSATPSEMHIFQCNRSHSAEIVDEIYKAKESGSSRTNGEERDNNNNNVSKNLKLSSNLGLASSSHQMSPQRRATFSQRIGPSANPTRIEMEVQVLNHCFDDIERFVTRLQNSNEVHRELEKRQKHRKSHKKHLGDGMLGMRAQMPPPQQYLDIYQKFKHSFNLLAKLKAHIHDPNAPELVHFLFTPLSLIVNTTKEQPYRGLSKTVWNPLLTKDAKDLLLNCLTSKEQDLWLLLGDSWSVTVEEATAQPHLYGHLDNQRYSPVFSDGWSPNFSDDRAEFSKLAFATAAEVSKQPVPIQKQRYYSNTQPAHYESQYRIQNQYDAQASQSSARFPNIRNYDAMKKWAVDLCYRGAKIYEVTHDRQANNEKELTIKVGELLEVLDDKRNWWRLRNFQGEIGHAPVTILRPFEFNNNNAGGFDSEKFNEYSKHNTYKMATLQLSQFSPETCSSSSSSFSTSNNLTNNVTNEKTYESGNSVLSPVSVTSFSTHNLNSKTYLIKNTDDYHLGSSFNNQVPTPNTSSESYNYSSLQPSKSFDTTNSSNEYSNRQKNISSIHNNSSSFVHSLYSNVDKIKHNQAEKHAPNMDTPKVSLYQSYLNNELPIKPLTINDEIKQNPMRFLRKMEPKVSNPKTDSIQRPIKELLHDEINKRMSQKKELGLKKNSGSELRKQSEIFINSKSTPSEVKVFLKQKDFSERIISMFGELTGEQLFTLERADFEKFCYEEAAHLDSQILVQKSLCGYNDKPTNELENILKKRKERSEFIKN